MRYYNWFIAIYLWCVKWKRYCAKLYRASKQSKRFPQDFTAVFFTQTFYLIPVHNFDTGVGFGLGLLSKASWVNDTSSCPKIKHNSATKKQLSCRTKVTSEGEMDHICNTSPFVLNISPETKPRALDATGLTICKKCVIRVFRLTKREENLQMWEQLTTDTYHKQQPVISPKRPVKPHPEKEKERN